MPFQATALQVFIASPGDIVAERVLVADQINVWNREHAATQGFVFVPVAWEWAVPSQGYTGQEQVNRQQVHRADVVIAMFKGRLGLPTKYPSGTAEEISVAHGRGAKVSVLVCEKPEAPGVYAGEEFDRLQTYLADIRSWGLTQTFKADHELRGLVDRILWQARNQHALDAKKVELDARRVERTKAYKRAIAGDKSPEDTNRLREAWPEIMLKIQKRRRTTQILLESASVSAVVNGVVYLTVPSPGMARRVVEPANLELLVQAMRDTLNVDWKVICDSMSQQELPG